jgi:hypothetical protein
MMNKNYSLESVKEMAGDDNDFVKVIVETFLEEIPADVNLMTEAIENENSAVAYQFAHKMKPNLQLFGLELMDQILIIEAWSKSKVNSVLAKEAGEQIASKVHLAEGELKKDFEL